MNITAEGYPLVERTLIVCPITISEDDAHRKSVLYVGIVENIPAIKLDLYRREDLKWYITFACM